MFSSEWPFFPVLQNCNVLFKHTLISEIFPNIFTMPYPCDFLILLSPKRENSHVFHNTLFLFLVAQFDVLSSITEPTYYLTVILRGWILCHRNFTRINICELVFLREGKCSRIWLQVLNYNTRLLSSKLRNTIYRRQRLRCERNSRNCPQDL